MPEAALHQTPLFPVALGATIHRVMAGCVQGLFMTHNFIASILIIEWVGIGPTNAAPEIRSCGGILHRDKDGLRFGRGKGEPEFICVISRSEDQKVLARCRVGKYCEVEGLADFCLDAGECLEISRVHSVRTSPRQHKSS